MTGSNDQDEPIDESEQSEARRKKAELFALQEAEDWKWLMADARGRRIVWGLLDKAGVFRTSFTGDASQTLFNEGQRNVGLLVTARATDHASEQYMKMLNEAKS